MMNALEDAFNEVSDGSAVWWPFAFLRPAPHQRLTSARVLVLAALYGIFAGLLVDVIARACNRTLPVHPGAFPIGMTLALFIAQRFTFAYFWNRRAARLSIARARRAAWCGTDVQNWLGREDDPERAREKVEDDGGEDV